MRIAESQLRRIIREELLDETLQGFRDRTSNIEFSGNFYDPTFEADPTSKKLARDVKRAWNEEADHSFMDSIIKIHWFASGGSERTAAKMMERFLSMPRSNEISTTGYLPNSDEFVSMWSDFGIIVKGRATFASNNMDTVASGYGRLLPDEVKQKYKSSGIPKRPTIYNTAGDKPQHDYDDYILDAESFVPDAQDRRIASRVPDASRENEFIVKHWTPVAIIRSFKTKHLMVFEDRVLELMEIEKLVKSGGITKEQFEIITIAEDLDEAVQLAREGTDPDQLRSMITRFSLEDSGPGWTFETYTRLRNAFSFNKAFKGFQKFGLPVVDRHLKPVWTPKQVSGGRT